MQSCNEYRVLISLHIDGQLYKEQKSAFEAHLSGCEACRKELSDMKEIAAACSELCEIELPSDFNLKLREKLNIETKTYHIPPFMREWKTYYAAAAVFVLIVVGSYYVTNNVAPSKLAKLATDKNASKNYSQNSGGADKGTLDSSAQNSKAQNESDSQKALETPKNTEKKVAINNIKDKQDLAVPNVAAKTSQIPDTALKENSSIRTTTSNADIQAAKTSDAPIVQEAPPAQTFTLSKSESPAPTTPSGNSMGGAGTAGVASITQVPQSKAFINYTILITSNIPSDTISQLGLINFENIGGDNFTVDVPQDKYQEILKQIESKKLEFKETKGDIKDGSSDIYTIKIIK